MHSVFRKSLIVLSLFRYAHLHHIAPVVLRISRVLDSEFCYVAKRR